MSLYLQVFVRKAIELHDKYLKYVNECFENHSLFHKVFPCIFLDFLNLLSFILINEISFPTYRHSRKPLKSFATRESLEAPMQNC